MEEITVTPVAALVNASYVCFQDDDWTIVGNPGPLFAALAAAQAEFKPLTKEETANVRSDKGSYSFDYATLERTLASTVPALNKHGIAFSQPVSLKLGGK